MPAVPDGLWHTWSAWSQCSVACEGGTQTRRRTCSSQKCVGSTTDTRDCNTDSCESNTLVCTHVIVL